MERRKLSKETHQKILRCAAEILSMHGEVAGNRVCQDWSGDEETKPSIIFSKSERDDIEYNSQIRNSNLDDYESGYNFPDDEMSISFSLSNVLNDIADGES